METTTADRRGTRSVGVSITGIVVVAVVLVLLVVVRGRAANDDQARTEAQRALGAVAVDVAQRYGTAVSGMLELSIVAEGRSPSAAVSRSVGGFDSVGFLPSGERVAVGSVPPVIVDAPQLGVLLSRARDSGDVVAAPPIDGRVVLARALYATASSPAAATPDLDTTAGRRDSFAGTLIAVIRLDDLVRADRSIEIRDGSAVLLGGPLSRETATAEVDVLDRRLTIEAELSPSSSLPLWTWIGVAGILAVAAGLAAITVRSAQARRSALLAVRREQRRSAAIGDLAATLQHSLELADVLPSLALQLADRFGLVGISVSVADGSGSVSELFAHGRKADPEVPALLDLPAVLGPEESAALALTRAGRLIAELRFRAGRPLDSHDLDTVQAAAELVTSAIVTAQAVERQQRAMDQLTELDGLKTVFLSTAAHELRTPVTAVNGLADLLSTHWENLPDAERRLMAGRIAANGQSLGALVQDLLDFSRLETGDVTHADDRIDLAELVAAVVDRLRVVWREHDVAVDVEPDTVIMGDALALERIMTNLVSNAAKYSPAGSTVRLTVRRLGPNVELLVDDDGPGVPISERDRIFGRFYRGEGPEVLRTRGVGIGLSVVREFVRQIGGTVDVVDAPSGGARFRCRFPRAPEPEPPQVVQEQVDV